MSLMVLSPNVSMTQETQAPHLIITPENVDDISHLLDYQSHTSRTYGIAFDLEGRHLFAVGENEGENFSVFTVFSLENREFRIPEQPQLRGLQDVQFIAGSLAIDETMLLIMNGNIVVWDILSDAPVGVISQNYSTITTHLGHRWILVASGETGLLSVWDIPSLPPSPTAEPPPPPPPEPPFDWIASLKGATQLDGPIADVGYDPVHGILVLGRDGNLHRLLLNEGFIFEHSETLPQEPPVGAQPQVVARDKDLIAFDSEQEWIAYAGSYQDVVVYDYDEGQQLLRYPVDEFVVCLMTSPNKDLLVIGDNGPNATLIFINTSTFEEVGRVNIGSFISDCAFSPDGTMIATATEVGVTSLWGIQ